MKNTAMESGNYALALKLASEQQRKKPSSIHEAERINAMAHLDPPKALDALDELVKSTPSDPLALKMVLETYDLLDREAPDVFEAATRKYGSGMLILEWNNFSLEEGDYLSFQKSSMLLKKLMGVKVDEKTQAVRFRAVASIVIACGSVSLERLDNGKRTLLSMIGLKLVEESGLDDGQMDAHQMFLKVKLQCIRGDYEGVVKSLEVFLQRERDLELLLIYFDALRKLEKWVELKEACLEYLRDVDDWDTWKMCIMAVKNLDGVDEFKSVLGNHKQSRNVALARIEVEEGEDAKLEAIEGYLKVFMRKPCCFQDLKLVIDELSADKVMSLVEKVFAEAYGGKSGDDLIIVVNYMKFKAKLVGMNANGFIDECWKYYNETIHLLEKLPEYDFHAGYELIMLIVQGMLLGERKLSSELVLKLIVILEWALQGNKFEFHLKLWLVDLYKLVGQPSLAIDQHNEMKIKNMQLDTIGIHTLVNCARIGATSVGGSPLQSKEAVNISDLLAGMGKLYRSSVEREIYPSIMQCMDGKVWQKMRSFMDLQNRMRHSLSKYYLTLVEMQVGREKGGLNGKELMDKLVILKECYKRSKTTTLTGPHSLNIDTDVKVNDNIDRSTMWDCGVHEPIPAIQAKLMDISISKVRVMCAMQLVVYDPRSLIWDELVGELVGANLEEFSEVEQWCVRTLGALMTGGDIKRVPAPPKDVISCEFNSYYASLLDMSRMLEVVVKSPHEGVQVKEVKKQRKVLGDTVRRMISRGSEVKRELRIELKRQFDLVGKWTEQNPSVGVTRGDVARVVSKFGLD